MSYCRQMVGTPDDGHECGAWLPCSKHQGQSVDLVYERWNTAGEFVKLLWPNGVPPESFGDMLVLVRVFDKMKRIATDRDAFGEDPWRDIAGYALLSIERRFRPEG